MRNSIRTERRGLRVVTGQNRGGIAFRLRQNACAGAAMKARQPLMNFGSAR